MGHNFHVMSARWPCAVRMQKLGWVVARNLSLLPACSAAGQEDQCKQIVRIQDASKSHPSCTQVKPRSNSLAVLALHSRHSAQLRKQHRATAAASNAAIAAATLGLSPHSHVHHSSSPEASTSPAATHLPRVRRALSVWIEAVILP